MVAILECQIAKKNQNGYTQETFWHKLHHKEFLQENRSHSERETWAILRSFGYSSLISDPDMIW